VLAQPTAVWPIAGMAHAHKAAAVDGFLPWVISFVFFAERQDRLLQHFALGLS